MSAAEGKAFFAALRAFAQAVTDKTTTVTSGEPEDQLRAPFETLMAEVGRILGRRIVCTGETKLAERLGRPDYAVHASKLLAGYVELKAPGEGANSSSFKGRNRDQWKRFSALPNLIYSDGNDWALYRSGEAAEKIVRISGDVANDGRNAVTAKDASALLGLFTSFLSWQPSIPTTKKGTVDLKGLAKLLAPLCRKLREDVAEAIKDRQSPLVQLAKDWRQLLFPDASDERFADSYAQTVAFALLLGRSEGADPLSLSTAQTTLSADHTLLSRALQVLTDPNAQAEISSSLDTLVRVIGAVPASALRGEDDPWLYFYEDFLAVYDPKLRKDIGAYYTPVEVVRAQVRLIDDLLTDRLGKALGFAHRDVVTLDPAVGTGTYLLGVIQHALEKVHAREGAGAVAGQATALAKNIYGFEILVGPFAVSELRISRALENRGADSPSDGTHIFLTDTLESPYTKPQQLPLYLRPISDQHARALKVKDSVPVIICLGNPPYDRHEAADPTNLDRTGGWVRYGDPIVAPKQKKKGRIQNAIAVAKSMMRLREQQSILHKDFLKSAIDAGHGGDLKNVYNQYVYFWRWALWKVFEHTTSAGPGIVSYISASSYLDGDAFCGMREHMRRLCDEIWILDLGGEGRGTRKNENIFAIQTPVAIAIALRLSEGNDAEPAKVRYLKVEGSREEKLAQLDTIKNFKSQDWLDCSNDWLAPFIPSSGGKYQTWPLLSDLFPWQHSGLQFKRKWPISTSKRTLQHRWKALLKSTPRASYFKESRDRKIKVGYPPLPGEKDRKPPIAKLEEDSRLPRVERYAYRSFDRQYILADNRLGDFLRPTLWEAHSKEQVYLTSLLTKPLGDGPALTACAQLPDLDHFSGRGAKDVIPFFRDAAGKEPNVLPGILEILTKSYRRKISADDFLAYVYGILAHPAFTERYADELVSRELRVPITTDADLFIKVRDSGAQLLWLHTYGERFVAKDRPRGQVPKGEARSTKPVPGSRDEYPAAYTYDEETKTLTVGEGAFSPVEPEVYNFEVSGLKVVQSWLGYRMKKPKGRKSSPLDEVLPEKWTGEFTTELLELLWILEATIKLYPTQAKLLSEVARKRTLRL